MGRVVVWCRIIGAKQRNAAKAPIVFVRILFYFTLLPPKKRAQKRKNLSTPRNMNRSGRYPVHITYGPIAKVSCEQHCKKVQ